MTNGPRDGGDDDEGAGVEQDRAGEQGEPSENAPPRPKPLALAPPPPRPNTKLTLVGKPGSPTSSNPRDAKVVSLQAARDASLSSSASSSGTSTRLGAASGPSRAPTKTPAKPPKPTIAEQLAAQKKRSKAQAEAERKANKKRRPKQSEAQRDALFRGFKEALERAAKDGGSFAADDAPPSSERSPEKPDH